MPKARAGEKHHVWREYLPPLPRLGPLVVIGRVLLAPAIYAAMLFVIYLVYQDPQLVRDTFGRSLLVFVIGKFSATGGQEDILYWVLVLGSVDVLVGLFLIWNFYLLFRVPGLGPLLRLMETRGSRFLEQNGWVRRVAFVGVAVIVIVPFQGTGAVMGSIVGRLIGLGRWRTLGAIAVGGYTGFALFLSASWLVALLGRVNLLVALAALLFLIGVGFSVWAQWFRVRRRRSAPGGKEAGEAQEDQETAPAGPTATAGRSGASKGMKGSMPEEAGAEGTARQ